MSTKKQQRVAEQIQEILSRLIQLEVRDPRLQGLTIMDVEIDRELMYATVYVNSLLGEEMRGEVMKGLQAATGFLRRELAAQVHLRHTPELRFRWDETLSRAEHIEKILDSLDIPPTVEEADGAEHDTLDSQ
jgi:ribosome-binding factor A